MEKITINKNRGWRGLAEAVVKDQDGKTVNKMIFSFSNNMWLDLMNNGKIVTQDQDFYYVITISEDDRVRLPIGHQRSVLIKNFTAAVAEVNKYAKASWGNATGIDWSTIMHFLKNKNNHTQSDWNCIGIRVIPEI